jgi:hypothetical protein
LKILKKLQNVVPRFLTIILYFLYFNN